MSDASILELIAPFSDQTIEILHAGDKVLLSGVIYTGRDAAHKRLYDLLMEDKPFPVDLKGQVIYYVGPAPAKPGRVIGSAGPTTSGRMDAYTPALIEYGLKGMIGKGSRSKDVIDAMIRYKAVYLGATGGAAALISRSIKRCEVVAFEDLGTEAIHRLEVEEFPLFVINDIYGGDMYRDGVEKYRRLGK